VADEAVAALRMTLQRGSVPLQGRWHSPYPFQPFPTPCSRVSYADTARWHTTCCQTIRSAWSVWRVHARPAGLDAAHRPPAQPIHPTPASAAGPPARRGPARQRLDRPGRAIRPGRRRAGLSQGRRAFLRRGVQGRYRWQGPGAVPPGAVERHLRSRPARIRGRRFPGRGRLPRGRRSGHGLSLRDRLGRPTGLPRHHPRQLLGLPPDRRRPHPGRSIRRSDRPRGAGVPRR
jgi:hypothetical protein